MQYLNSKFSVAIDSRLSQAEWDKIFGKKKKQDEKSENAPPVKGQDGI